MKLEELLDNLYKTHGNPPSQPRPNYIDITSSPIIGFMNIYPDNSRTFDALFFSICMITRTDSSILTSYGSCLFRHIRGKFELSFKDGYLNPPHKSNSMELDYVMEGRFHKQIEGKDYVFNKGEFLLINQGVSHSDYLYSRNMTVITLHISNEFLNKTMNHSEIALAGKEAEEFYNRFITKGRGEYHFVRFTPKEHSTPVLFEQIINELIEPGAGSSYIVMGYVDRLLSLIPLEYQVDVEWGGKKVAEKNLFEKILFLLEDCHEDVSLQDLVAAFGHNPDYFNRLIKRYRGMTYSEFLQNIRLEKAEQLLRTTEYPIEAIANKVGYKNVSYFYKIFIEKFQMSPGEMRKNQ